MIFFIRMGKKHRKIKIFISYSWAKQSKAIADQLYDDLNIVSLKDKMELIKDDQSLHYKFSIEEFMKNIRKTDYAILLIGKDYLRSLNCMKEVLHLRQDVDQKKKMLPILIGDANLFNTTGRLEYVEFWKEKKEELSNKIKNIDPTSCISSIEDLKIIGIIEATIDEFLKEISEIKLFTYQYIKDDKYNILFKTCNINTGTDNLYLPILIDKKKHLLDQLYDTISLYFKSFNFLPKNRLKLLYPFNLRGMAYQYGGGIHSDNDDLIKLLLNIEALLKGETNDSIAEIKKIENHEEKIDTIINVLCRNQIFTIDNHKNKISISDLKKRKDEKCDCIRCCFESFRFNELLERLDNKMDFELDDSMTKAFIHYKIGNYHSSLKLFKQCSEQAEKEFDPILKYICDYNVLTLNSFVDWRKRNDNDSLYNIFREKESILPKERDLINTGFNLDFIRWIHEQKFFSANFYDIDNILREIRDHYQLVQNGGFSYNSNVSNLIHTYFNLFSFLYKNNIVFDSYSDYTNFARKYIEGIFICLSLPESQGISSVNKSFIYQVLFYGEHKDLITFSNRYKVSKINYQNEDDIILLDLFSNFCDSVDIEYINKLDNKNDRFYPYNERLLNNFLILANFLNLKEEELDKFTSKLIIYLDKVELNLYSFKYLFNFCDAKVDKISDSNSIKILIKIFTSGEFIYEFHSYWFANIIERNNLKIEKITSFQYLIDSINDIDSIEEKCQQIQDHLPILKMFPSKQIALKEYIYSVLEQYFDSELYYSSCINHIIDYKIFWDKFSNECIDLTIKHPERQNRFCDQDNYTPYSAFGFLIDLCFQFDINTKGKQFDAIRKLTPFYAWILDMKSFDYDKFNIQWLKVYRSDIFAKKYAKISQIKELTKEHLRHNKDSLLEDFFLKYY